MVIQHNIYLVKAIVDALIFLEFTDDNVIDPDVAVAATEQIAAELQSMDMDSRSAFCSQVYDLTKNYSKDKADFVRELPESIGLV